MAVYRSLRTLKAKGLADQTKARGRVWLTPEGEEVARGLLLNSMDFNIKGGGRP
jgi:DNA-binding IclR family transcriptional regulator